MPALQTKMLTWCLHADISCRHGHWCNSDDSWINFQRLGLHIRWRASVSMHLGHSKQSNTTGHAQLLNQLVSPKATTACQVMMHFGS